MKLYLLLGFLTALVTGNEVEYDELTDEMVDVAEDPYADIPMLDTDFTQAGLVTSPEVNFTIYSRNNCSGQVFLNSTPATCFDPRRPTKILIHGFLARGRTFNQMKDAYLYTSDCNVVIVDWSRVATCWRTNMDLELTKSCYRTIVKTHLKNVSQYVSLLLGKLNRAGQDPGEMHIVGHNLGAHIAGQASQIAKEHVARNLGRITGLDPASPLFRPNNLTQILDKSDAEFVDVIHANIDYMGWKGPLGTADFYVYGGKKQPGCAAPSSMYQICSYSKTLEYFTKTILDIESFMAVPCGELKNYERYECTGADYVYMGESVSHSAKGSYYVLPALKRQSAALTTSAAPILVGIAALTSLLQH